MLLKNKYLVVLSAIVHEPFAKENKAMPVNATCFVEALVPENADGAFFEKIFVTDNEATVKAGIPKNLRITTIKVSSVSLLDSRPVWEPESTDKP